MFKLYLKRILEVARQGDATEESYYPILKELLENYKKNAIVTVQPKKTEAGNPDFRVWDGKQKITGYIEAKTPDRNLDDAERTGQIKRYKNTFKNFLLTNFLEFKLYKDGSLIEGIRIVDPVSIYSLKGIPPIKDEEGFKNILEKFFSFSFPKITSAIISN